MKNIGKTIKETRKNQLMSIQELSLISGISVSTLARYESNKTDISIINLINIANALNVSPKIFFEDYDDIDPITDPILKAIENVAQAEIHPVDDITDEPFYMFKYDKYGFEEGIPASQFKKMKNNIINYIKFELYKNFPEENKSLVEKNLSKLMNSTTTNND